MQFKLGMAGTVNCGHRVVIVGYGTYAGTWELCFDDNSLEVWSVEDMKSLVVWDVDPTDVVAVPPPLPLKVVHLPADSAARKALPVFSGVVKYFPLAVAKVSNVSKKGNDQHNPGQPLHWARGKSTDQLDAAQRHLIDVAIKDLADEDATEELAQVAWRILAELQLRLEKKGGLETP